MDEVISRITVHEYLHALRRIFAVTEIGFTSHPNSEKLNDLHLFFLRDELGESIYFHAMDIVAVWLRGSKFETDSFRILKKDPAVKWTELMGILRGKMAEYAYDKTVVKLLFSPEGRMTHADGTDDAHCDFEDGSMNHVMLRMLVAARGNFVPTKEIIESTHCKDLKALSEQKRTVNTALRLKLNLPGSIDVIDSKVGSGYRIHPFYHIVPS